MNVRKLPDLSPAQVKVLQDAVLANADRLLRAALTMLDSDNVGLARSLAILGMEETGKAIAIHERRVGMAYAPEGEPFVDSRLEELWASHTRKLELVHDFLVEELYWFDVEPSDPDANLAYLGSIKAWTGRHDRLKQRGFYVEMDRAGGTLSPTDVSDPASVAIVIEHVHQIGWQLRLGEHIEAKKQAEEEAGVAPLSDDEVREMQALFQHAPSVMADEEVWTSMRQGQPGRRLNNDAYRLRLPAPGTPPFEQLGKPGYEAQTRELMRLAEGPGPEDTA